MNDIALFVKGKQVKGWRQVKVQKSLSQIVGTFGFLYTNLPLGKLKDWPIQMGDPCMVSVNGYTLITGFVDSMPVEYNKEIHNIQAVGRGKTGDLVDCDHAQDVNEWIDETVLNILIALLEPFDIGIEVDESIESIVEEKEDRFKANEGDKVFELIANLCLKHAILPISSGDGQLTLTRSGNKGTSEDVLKTGANIMSAQMEQSNNDRYSNYIVKGQGNGFDTKDVDTITRPGGQAVDGIIQRYRPLVILAETATDLKQTQARADWESRVRAGKSRAVTYTVQGWAQSNNKPWEVNSLVRVQDDVLNIDDTMLITDLLFSIEPDKGTTTSITVMHRNTFELFQAPVKEIKSVLDPKPKEPDPILYIPGVFEKG